MASILEEARNLMPGRARKHWSLTADGGLEEGALDDLFSDDDEDEEEDERLYQHSMAEMQKMIPRLNKAQPRFRAALEKMSGYGGWTSYGAAMRHGRVFVPFGTFAALSLQLNHVDNAGVIRMYRVEYEVSPRHSKPNDVREVFLRINGTVRRKGTQADDRKFEKTFSFDLGRGSKSNRYDNPGAVFAKARPVFAKLNKMMPKGMKESVAGAPGAFAVSDAEPSTLEKMKADLIDRCRNPRWEYPSWALPKVELDEAELSALKMSKWDIAALEKNVRGPNDVFSKALKIAKAGNPVPWKLLYAVLNHLKKRRSWDDSTPSSEYRDEEGLIGKLEKNMRRY